jgi:hypothetical protein
MIMIPILIMQIFLFPLTASLIMNNWVDSRRTIALQETASHLSSTIQQLYSSLNHATISAGTVTNKLTVPPFIEGYAFSGNATWRTPSDGKILDLTLRLMGANVEVTASVTLGENAEWKNSTLMSNSTYAGINAEKMSNGTIRLYFGS